MCGQMETQLPTIVRLYFFSLSLFFVIPGPGMYGIMDTKTATSSTLFSDDSLHWKTEG